MNFAVVAVKGNERKICLFHLGLLCQLVCDRPVHAMAVGGDLLDLKLLLGQFLGQGQALLVPGALQVLHLRIGNPGFSLFLLGRFLVLYNGA